MHNQKLLCNAIAKQIITEAKFRCDNEQLEEDVTKILLDQRIPLLNRIIQLENEIGFMKNPVTLKEDVFNDS